jgi:hypothetical protein
MKSKAELIFGMAMTLWCLSPASLLPSQSQFRRLENGVPVSSQTTGLREIPDPGRPPRLWDTPQNQYLITIPAGMDQLRFRLEAAPTTKMIDLAVRLNQPVETVDDQLRHDLLSEMPGGVEEITISSPTPGDWYVVVGTRELDPVPFTLVATFGRATTILQLDDGGFETLLGYPEGRSQVHFVNRITPLRYPATLTGVQILFESRAEQLPVGTPITLVVGANAGGNPNINGIGFQRKREMVRFTDNRVFNSFAVEAVTIASGDFVIGFVIDNPPGAFPVAQDKHFPRGRSYLSTDGSTFLRVEEFGAALAGNFGIRAQVEGNNRSVIIPDSSSREVTGVVARDGSVEFEFDPASGAIYRFSTCDGAADFDTVIEVFQAGVLVAQNDNCSPTNIRSTVEVTVPGPGRMMVRVRGAVASATGTFRMGYRRIR